MKRESLTHSFGPVYDADSEVLILGSFPSVASRKQNFYYAHPRNRFWPLMAQLFDEEIIDRRQFCLSHHIALWDVIESCTIAGSSDASIRDVVPNPINELVAKTHIRAIFTTGSTASRLYERWINCDVAHYALPSTSPANAKMKMDDLLNEYRRITEVLYEKT